MRKKLLKGLDSNLGIVPLKSYGDFPNNEAVKSRKEADGGYAYSGQQLRGVKYIDDVDLMQKFVRKGDSLPEGTKLAIQNVITTGAEDRDGDFLNPKGAKLDQVMPLLWMHNPNIVLGKMINYRALDDKIKTVAVIIEQENEIARDAVSLFKADCLRFSIGFNAIKAHKRRDGKKGWNVEEFYIFEQSAVSVPANPEAIAEQISDIEMGSKHFQAYQEHILDLATKGHSQVVVPEFNIPVTLDLSIKTTTLEEPEAEQAEEEEVEAEEEQPETDDLKGCCDGQKSPEMAAAIAERTGISEDVVARVLMAASSMSGHSMDGEMMSGHHMEDKSIVERMLTEEINIQEIKSVIEVIELAERSHAEAEEYRELVASL